MSCYILTSIYVNHFNTSKTTNINSMFYLCSELKEIDISNFDTSLITEFHSLFYSCNSLTSINLGNNTKKIRNMSFMFFGCKSLEELDLSFFDTSELIEARSTFYGCINLTSIKFENLNTTKATSLKAMFSNCNSLEYLYFPYMITNHINYDNVYDIFEGCLNLKLHLHREKNIELVYSLPSYVEFFDINETIGNNNYN